MSNVPDLTELTDLAIERFDEQIDIHGLGRAEVTTRAEVFPGGGGRILVSVEIPTGAGKAEFDESLVSVLARTLRRTLVESLARGTQVGNVADTLSPALEVVPPPVLLQARRNAEARHDLLREFGAFTAAQVAEARGSRASNSSALAGRWRTEGRVFAVSYRGRTLFPAFQFDDDIRPLPVIASAVERFKRERMSDWEIALWFTTSTGALADRRPVDLLHDDPDAVLAAAEAELAPASG
jgi:hypothetical protein